MKNNIQVLIWDNSFFLADHMGRMFKTKKSSLAEKLEKDTVFVEQIAKVFMQNFRWNQFSEKHEIFWSDLLPYSWGNI